MSDDLISRKAVSELIESKVVDGCLQIGEDTPLISSNELLDDVSDLNTAYDFDKTINELENAITLVVKQYPLQGKYLKQSMVIDIVKAGGA